ncbi:MAG: hypothetical protein KF784_13095 [Fimbriimonadaceae bacterium]|nr:hypothetical protein [Fimbriimonadaceae bacterium]
MEAPPVVADVKPRWKWICLLWIAIALTCPFIGYQALFRYEGSAPHNVVDYVPYSTKLSDLDRYLIRGIGSEGEVEGTILEPDGSGKKVEVKEDYDRWKATPEERARFTGKITFYHMGTTSTDVNEFVFQDGKLVDKDWGFLPG